MLTQTSEIAIKALIFLALREGEQPVPPKSIAEKIGCSPTYLAKVMGQLAKYGILRSQRGPQGGMTLDKAPEEISLLDIIEACQGLLIANYCKAIGDATGPVCGFHQAMWEVHQAMSQILKRWRLSDLMKQPLPTGELAGNQECILNFLRDSLSAETQ